MALKLIFLSLLEQLDFRVMVTAMKALVREQLSRCFEGFLEGEPLFQEGILAGAVEVDYWATMTFVGHVVYLFICHRFWWLIPDCCPLQSEGAEYRAS